MAPDTSGRLDDVVRHILARPDDALDLESLAHRASLSPFHFQRWFKAETGRTPRQFVEATRVDRAARDLIFHDRSALDVGLDCGYQNAETFSRAFRRRLGVTPSEFRRRGRLDARVPLPDRSVLETAAGRYELSTTRVQFLRPRFVAAHRHRGDYEGMGQELWEDLTEELDRHGLEVERYLGIGWDPPSDDARFDAAATVSRDFEPSGRLTRLELPSGPFALTSHVGPYQTLTSAMLNIVQAAAELEGYSLVGPPVIEVYHTDRMDENRPANMTDIYMLLREDPK